MTNANIRTEYLQLKRQAANYAKRYGVEDTTPSAKHPTAKTVEKVRKELEKMQTKRWARKTLSEYRKKRNISEEEWRKDPYKKETPEESADWEEVPADTSGQPGATSEPDWSELPDFEADTTELENLIDKANSLYNELIGYYNTYASKWPIEEALELLISELENIRDNQIDEAIDSINRNKDEINHLLEQAVSYKKKEKRGAQYYVNFISQIQGILHGTSWLEIDADGMY